MSFCDGNELDLTDLLSDLTKIGSRLGDIASGANGSNQTLQQLALIQDLSSQIKDLIAKLTEATGKALICFIMESFDLEAEIEQLELKMSQIFDLIENAEAKVDSLDSTDFDALESGVSTIVDEFNGEKDRILEIVNEFLRESISAPLITLGATQNEINTAFNEIELQEDVSSFVIEIFNRILEQVLQRYDG